MGTRRPPMHAQRDSAVGGRRRGDEAHHTVSAADGTSTLDGDVPLEGRPQATSQARGMLSVSRVRPMPTAMSANAGPVTRWSSARVDASATLT